MKKDLSFVEKHRFRTPMMADAPTGCFGGCFIFQHKGKMLNCIATDGKGDPELLKPEQVWEHVSCHCLDPALSQRANTQLGADVLHRFPLLGRG